MERTFGHFYVVLFVVGLLLATAWSLAGQEYQGDQEELDTPAARATIRAAERLERRRSAMDPISQIAIAMMSAANATGSA